MWEKIKNVFAWIGAIAAAIAAGLLGRELLNFRRGSGGAAGRGEDAATKHQRDLERVRAASRDATAAGDEIADTSEALNGIANRSRRKRAEIADLDERIAAAIRDRDDNSDSIDDTGD